FGGRLQEVVLIARAQMEQQGGAQRLIVAEARDVGVDEGAGGGGDGLGQAFRATGGVGVAGGGVGIRTVECQLDGGADLVVDFQRRDVGIAISIKRIDAVIHESGAGGLRKERLDLERNRVESAGRDGV